MSKKNEMLRRLYDCPEYHIDKLPDIDKDFWDMMVEEAADNEDNDILVFGLVLQIDDIPTLFLFFWYEYCETDYEWFAIRQGYRLPRDKEERFFSYCQSRALIWCDYKKCMQSCSEAWPDIQWAKERWRTGIILQSYYYMLHKSGPTGVLSRAGLVRLAVELEKLECNLLGTTPETIFELPLGLLKILNESSEGVHVLQTADRSVLEESYSKFCDIIDEAGINCIQYRYLSEVLQGDRSFDSMSYSALSSGIWKHLCVDASGEE